MKPAVRFALRLAVGALLLALILRPVDWSALRAVSPERIAAGIALAWLLLLAGQSTAAARWKTLLGPASPPWSYLARLYVIGTFFSLFLPTVVGGDAMRAVAAAQSSERPGGVVASVLLDRVFGVVAMLGYLLIGLLAAPDVAGLLLGRAEVSLPRGSALPIAALLVLLGVAGVWLVRRSSRLRRWISEGWQAVTALSREPGRALAALLLAFVVQGIYVVLWVVLATAMGFDLPFAAFLIAVPLVTLGTMLPVSIAGLGLREGAWLLLLRNAAIPEAQVVAFSLLYFTANLLVGALGGGLLAWKGMGLSPAER